MDKCLCSENPILTEFFTLRFKLYSNNADPLHWYITQPLHYASKDPKFAEVLCLLMDMGADIEGENSEGETPLFSAVKSNNFHAAQLIIEAGANINHKNKMLLTSFQLIEVCIFIRYSIFLCDHKLDLFVFIFLVQTDYREVILERPSIKLPFHIHDLQLF